MKRREFITLLGGDTDYYADGTYYSTRP